MRLGMREVRTTAKDTRSRGLSGFHILVTGWGVGNQQHLRNSLRGTQWLTLPIQLCRPGKEEMRKTTGTGDAGGAVNGNLGPVVLNKKFIANIEIDSLHTGISKVRKTISCHSV